MRKAGAESGGMGGEARRTTRRRSKNEDASKGRLGFRVGLALIAISYPLWAAAVLFGALQLRRTEFPWWRAAATALCLNWLTFASGILIAGREAGRHLHKTALRRLKCAVMRIGTWAAAGAPR